MNYENCIGTRLKGVSDVAMAIWITQSHLITFMKLELEVEHV